MPPYSATIIRLVQMIDQSISLDTPITTIMDKEADDWSEVTDTLAHWADNWIDREADLNIRDFGGKAGRVREFWGTDLDGLHDWTVRIAY